MAAVAQLVEHLVVVRVVAGSSPVGRPILTSHNKSVVSSIWLEFQKALFYIT